MNNQYSYLSTIPEPEKVVTAIDSNPKFPEFLETRRLKYEEFIELFTDLVKQSNSSAQLLERIRTRKLKADVRMPLLKIFRRAVSPVIDTEKSKKLKIMTSVLVENYGDTFKDINLLKSQFINMGDAEKYALAALLGEYDNRGNHGYQLTELFFSWFEARFPMDFDIEGPRGAGKDIQLSSLYPNYKGNFPCDFVIKNKGTDTILAIGFARYDSTRGGSQSDDRTGGNNDKVLKAEEFRKKTKSNFKIVFISDGPGLTHKDTWEETCILDGKLNDNVRVSTLKLAETRITKEWLRQ